MPPTITSFIVDDGTPQRSMVRTLHVTFSEIVTLDAGAFQLVTPNGLQAVMLNTATHTDTSGDTIADIRFAGAGISG